jgi:adenylate kinase family enzyme
MNPIFLIVGPPAVGKSTTSRALANRFPLSIHIPVDDLRNMVVSGLALPSAEWNAALQQQITLARTTVIQMALAYQQAGFTVIIDDFYDTHLTTDYHTLLQQPHLHKIVLHPDQSAAHHRNFTRAGDSPARAYIDVGIRIVYQQLQPALTQLKQSGWYILDTTTLDVEASVSAILAAV